MQPLQIYNNVQITFSKPCAHRDIQVREGQDLSCSICRTLDECNGRIVEIRRNFERDFTCALEQRRAFLEEVNHVYDPIQRIPAEIASSIFSFCLAPLDLSDFSLSQDHPFDAPVQFCLGSVCRYWRQVVCSTPQLWNVFWFHVSLRTTKVHSEILAEWLGRSGQLPLYISMIYIPDYNERAKASPASGIAAWSFINRMMNLLFLNVMRIKVLKLSLLASQISHFKLLRDSKTVTSAVTATSILEKLSIDAIDAVDDSVANFSLHSWTLSPMHVSLRGMRPRHIGVQWEHVTWVEAEDTLTETALEIIELAPQLQHLELQSPEVHCYGGDQATRIAYNLKSLHLLNINSDNFLLRIKCPTLEELSSPIGYGPPILQDFVKRSKLESSLKKLTLDLLSMDTNDLVPLLRLTRSVTYLCLKCSKIPDEFLKIFTKTAYFEREILASGSSATLFLPHLRSFNWMADLWGFQWSDIPSIIPPPCDDVNLVCRPLSEIEIVFSSIFNPKSDNPDPESLKLAFGLIQDGRISLKFTDDWNEDLTKLLHDSCM